jgi:hypothetical protein
MALAAGLSAIAVDGCEAGQGGEGLGAEGAEFGELGDKGSSDDETNAWHGGEKILLLAPGGCAAGLVVDLLLELGEFLLEESQEAVGALDQAALGELAAPVSFGDHHLDQLAPPGDEFAESPGCVIWDGWNPGMLDRRRQTAYCCLRQPSQPIG